MGKQLYVVCLVVHKLLDNFRERVSNLAESEELLRLRAQLAPTRNAHPPTQVQSQKNKLQGVSANILLNY